ncbi:hypothetical protein ACVXG7_27905 [Enterobacter hormaechei]
MLDHPVRWSRDPDNPTFSGALALDAGQTALRRKRAAAVRFDLQR